MAAYKFTFIGTGNMGGALARAAGQALGAEEVVLSNRTPEKAETLAREIGCRAYPSNREAAQAADTIPNELLSRLGDRLERVLTNQSGDAPAL